MPQMSPLMWIYLYIYNLMTLILVISLIYFMTEYSMNKGIPVFKKMKKSFYFKW